MGTVSPKACTVKQVIASGGRVRVAPMKAVGGLSGRVARACPPDASEVAGYGGRTAGQRVGLTGDLCGGLVLVLPRDPLHGVPAADEAW